MRKDGLQLEHLTDKLAGRPPVEEPLRQIVQNEGEDAAVVLNNVRAGKGSYGYNAATGEYGDMLEEGILDPAKVTRLAASTP